MWGRFCAGIPQCSQMVSLFLRQPGFLDVGAAHSGVRVMVRPEIVPDSRDRQESCGVVRSLKRKRKWKTNQLGGGTCYFYLSVI